MFRKIVPLLFAASALLVLNNCVVLEAFGSVSSVSESFSKILDSISDSLKSISNSLESSSESSSGGKEKVKAEAFYRDVRSLVAVAVRDGATSTRLMREIGSLARSHGVQDWEKMPGTVRAIGGGLKDAGVDAKGYADLRGRLEGRPRTIAFLDQGYFGR